MELQSTDLGDLMKDVTTSIEHGMAQFSEETHSEKLISCVYDSWFNCHLQSQTLAFHSRSSNN